MNRCLFSQSMSVRVVSILVAGVFLMLAWLPMRCHGQAIGVALEQDLLSSFAWGGKDEATIELELKEFATIRIERMKELYQLDEEQVKRLNFAFRADLERYRRKVKMIQEKLGELDDQETIWQDASEIVAPITSLIQAKLFDDDCLLKKTIDTTLRPEQLASYKEYLENKKKRYAASLVKSHLFAIEKHVPIMQDQRANLHAELTRFCESFPNLQSQHSYVLIACLFSKIPDSQLADNFQLDKGQIAAWNEFHSQYDGYEQWLAQFGFDIDEFLEQRPDLKIPDDERVEGSENSDE